MVPLMEQLWYWQLMLGLSFTANVCAVICLWVLLFGARVRGVA